MEVQRISELDVSRPIERHIDVSAGGEVADVDVRKEGLIAKEADDVTISLESCVMTAEMTAASGEARRKRRCRRKRKAGEHHRAPPDVTNHRRCRHGRIWKPYTDMTWEERRVRDELEASRATRRRDRRLASGQAMAPYNTTQFLMEQYDTESLMQSDGIWVAEAFKKRDMVVAPVRPRSPESSATGGDSTSVGDDDEEELFLEREFNEAYNREQVERLEGMTKDELIRDLIQMEAAVELLQSRLNAADPVSELATPMATKLAADDIVELRRLSEENSRLIQENENLRREMAAFLSSSPASSPLLSSECPMVVTLCMR